MDMLKLILTYLPIVSK